MNVNDKWLLSAPGINREISALSPDPNNSRPILDALTQRLGKRREVAVDPLRPSWVTLLR